MHPIFVLWSHPRSMSTAMERVMRERGDLACFHEPFMYDYYIHRAVRRLPHFEPMADHPIRYEDVRDMLLARAESQPVFVKDMSYYVMPRILQDRPFGERLVDCFLVRDPIFSILSYHKLDPDLTLEEIGLEAQWRHYEGLRKSRGKRPLVVCAEDVRVDTKGTIAALWRALGLPFVEKAFDWQGTRPSDWEQVGAWHEDVSASTGIRPIAADETRRQEAAFAETARAFPVLQAYLDHHRPYYEALRADAIRA